MDEKEIIEQAIRNLECDLAATDYKVIKCYEAELVGEEFPYDITTLHKERQAMRDKINKLKAELEKE